MFPLSISLGMFYYYFMPHIYSTYGPSEWDRGSNLLKSKAPLIPCSVALEKLTTNYWWILIYLIFQVMEITQKKYKTSAHC